VDICFHAPVKLKAGELSTAFDFGDDGLTEMFASII